MPFRALGRMIDLAGPRARRWASTQTPVSHPGQSSNAIERLVWSLTYGLPVAETCLRREVSRDDTVPQGLYEPFRAGKIIDLPSGDLEAVIEAFAHSQRPLYRYGRCELLTRMKARGANGFLITKTGIAITHPHHPLVLPVREPAITVCLLDEPTPMGGPTDPDVKAVIGVVAPRVGIYFTLLSLLSRLLADEDFVRLLDITSLYEEIMDRIWLHDCGLTDIEIDLPTGS